MSASSIPPSPASSSADITTTLGRSITALIRYLKSSFRDSDFSDVEQILITRERDLKQAISNPESNYKDHVNNLTGKISSLESLSRSLEAERWELTMKKMEVEDEYRKWRMESERAGEEVLRLEEERKGMMDWERRMGERRRRLEEEVEEARREVRDLLRRNRSLVLEKEKIAAELEGKMKVLSKGLDSRVFSLVDEDRTACPPATTTTSTALVTISRTEPVVAPVITSNPTGASDCIESDHVQQHSAEHHLTGIDHGLSPVPGVTTSSSIRQCNPVSGAARSNHRHHPTAYDQLQNLTSSDRQLPPPPSPSRLHLPSTTTSVDSQMDPGPMDRSVLTQQDEHRSKCVWEGVDSIWLTCRRREACLRRGDDLITLDHRMMCYIEEAGFLGVACMHFIRLDWHLITALVERWRPETHTFHMPQGEVTITLQDVAILLGLPVDGVAVTGSTQLSWTDVFERLLGQRPGEQDILGGRISLTWLSRTFQQLPDVVDDQTVA